jgi:hypothetical protein
MKHYVHVFGGYTWTCARENDLALERIQRYGRPDLTGWPLATSTTAAEAPTVRRIPVETTQKEMKD